ncbi:MAG: AraC family transcriptional regulator [Cyanobacteria bacterium P01_D01_bin.44]
MQPKAAQVSVQVWESDGILLEQYAYTSGAVTPLPKHTHAEYQFGLSFDCQGEYFYRGAHHVIPTGSLSVVHSGEVHAPSDRTALSKPVHFAMAHIDPSWLQLVAAEMAERPTCEPFFPTAFITDPGLNRLFLALQAATDRQTSKLEQGTALWDFLTHLFANHASDQSALKPVRPVHQAVAQARDYLQAHYADDISLEELAAIAGLSRFHFCRVFRKQVGISPAAYQTQLRIAQSRKLLAQGFPIATVVEMTGFYDHSHFGWHFKRQVGATPRSYVRKIRFER